MCEGERDDLRVQEISIHHRENRTKGRTSGKRDAASFHIAFATLGGAPFCPGALSPADKSSASPAIFSRLSILSASE